MARRRRRNLGTRLVDAVFVLMTRRGLGAPHRHLLTVRGRRSGEARTTPVDVMTVDGERYLVAGYGPAQWVLNVRSAAVVALSRGGVKEHFVGREIDPHDAVPVLRTYLREVPVTRAFWDVGPDAPDAEVAADGKRHPVFLLVPLS